MARSFASAKIGDLAWLDLSPKGATILHRAKLFNAPETWTPARRSADGLLYVCQNEPDSAGKAADHLL